MECSKCKGMLPDNVKSCPSCGQVVDSAGTADSTAKIVKLLKSTGGAVVAIGWITIVLNVGMYIWSLLDMNSYAYSKLPVTDLPAVVLMISAATLFIVFGNRVKSANDIKIQNNLIVLIILFASTYAFITYTGGKVGYLFLVALIYLIMSLVKVRIAIKDSNFSSNLSVVDYKIKGFGWVAVLILIVIVFFTSFKLNAIIQDKVFASKLKNPETKQEAVRALVVEAKAATTLPQQIDENTQAVDITEENGALRYHYVLEGGNTSGLTEERLKNFLLNGVCSNKATSKILDQEINIEYSYVLSGTDKPLLVSISKADCVK